MVSDPPGETYNNGDSVGEDHAKIDEARIGKSCDGLEKNLVLFKVERLEWNGD